MTPVNVVLSLMSVAMSAWGHVLFKLIGLRIQNGAAPTSCAQVES